MFRIAFQYNNTAPYRIIGAYSQFASLNNHEFVQHVRHFIAGADVSTKENYLAWVKDWKTVINALETSIRSLKTARKPSQISGLAVFKRALDMDFNVRKLEPTGQVEWFLDRRVVCLHHMQRAATELYRARRNMKLASRMMRELSKTNAR